MEKTPDNTVKVFVRQSIAQPQFYFVEGPGGTILSAGPRFDGATGEKEMTKQEIYSETEKILMLNRHLTHPEEYRTLNTYLSPDNMNMLTELDMRHKTLPEMQKKIIESTKT